MPKLQIIMGSTRPGRISPAIATWAAEQAAAHGGFDVEVIDLAEVDLPLFNEPNLPRLGDYVHDHTKAWAASVATADAFVLVMPEYNHSFTAPLKNALDYLSAEWAHKPVGFVSYGGVAAGSRAVQAIKPVVSALGLVPVAAGVLIPLVFHRIKDGQFTTDDALDTAAKLMFDDLARWTDVLAVLRTS